MNRDGEHVGHRCFVEAAVFVMAVALALAGCGGKHYWIKPGATEQEFQRDSYECATQSTHATRRAGLGGGGGSFLGLYQEGPAVNEDLYRACLRSRGYTRQTEQKGWRGIE